VPNYDEGQPGKGWIYVTKNRITGGTGATKLYFRQQHTRFIGPLDPETDIEPGQLDDHSNGAYAPKDLQF